jgi:hypothetical protein
MRREGNGRRAAHGEHGGGVAREDKMSGQYWTGFLKVAQQMPRKMHVQRIRARLDRAGMVLVWILTGAIWLVVAWIFVMWRRLEGEA